MKTRVQRWGNSLAVRIPKSFAEEIGLRDDAPVDLRLSEGTLVLQPCPPPAPELADLLDRVTESNTHGETRWGEARGREVW
jgi:antitoxin MazE